MADTSIALNNSDSPLPATISGTDPHRPRSCVVDAASGLCNTGLTTSRYGFESAAFFVLPYRNEALAFVRIDESNGGVRRFERPLSRGQLELH